MTNCSQPTLNMSDGKSNNFSPSRLTHPSHQDDKNGPLDVDGVQILAQNPQPLENLDTKSSRKNKSKERSLKKTIESRHSEYKSKYEQAYMPSEVTFKLINKLQQTNAQLRWSN